MAIYQAGSRMDGALLLDSQSTGTSSHVTFQEKFTADYHTYLVTGKNLASALDNWRLYMQLIVSSTPTTSNDYTSTIAENLQGAVSATAWGTAGSEVGYWVCFAGAGNATNEFVDCQIVITAPFVNNHYTSFVSDASFKDDASTAKNRWYRAGGIGTTGSSDGIRLYSNVGGVYRNWSSGGTFTLYALSTGMTI